MVTAVVQTAVVVVREIIAIPLVSGGVRFCVFFFSRATSYSGSISKCKIKLSFCVCEPFPSFVPAVRLVCYVVRLCCTLTWVDR